jgi:hypothetical protein
MMLNCDLRYVGLAFGPHESQGYVCILLFVDSFQARATKNDALPRRKTAVAEHFGVDSWDHIVASVTPRHLATAEVPPAEDDDDRFRMTAETTPRGHRKHSGRPAPRGGVIKPTREVDPKIVRAFFRATDADRDGKISVDELASIAAANSLFMPRETLAKMVADADVGLAGEIAPDGSISIHELLKALRVRRKYIDGLTLTMEFVNKKSKEFLVSARNAVDFYKFYRDTYGRVFSEHVEDITQKNIAIHMGALNDFFNTFVGAVTQSAVLLTDPMLVNFLHRGNDSVDDFLKSLRYLTEVRVSGLRRVAEDSAAPNRDNWVTLIMAGTPAHAWAGGTVDPYLPLPVEQPQEVYTALYESEVKPVLAVNEAKQPVQYTGNPKAFTGMKTQKLPPDAGIVSDRPTNYYPANDFNFRKVVESVPKPPERRVVHCKRVAGVINDIAEPSGEDPCITFGFAARGGFETAIVQKLYRDDRDRRALSGLNQVRRQQGEAMDYDWPAVLEPGVYREPIGTPGEENALLAHPWKSQVEPRRTGQDMKAAVATDQRAFVPRWEPARLSISSMRGGPRADEMGRKPFDATPADASPYNPYNVSEIETIANEAYFRKQAKLKDTLDQTLPEGHSRHMYVSRAPPRLLEHPLALSQLNESYMADKLRPAKEAFKGRMLSARGLGTSLLEKRVPFGTPLTAR